MTDDALHELVAAYALDALDDAERAAFEQHLGGCADCRTEVSALRETAGLLAEGLAQEPSAALRAAVLAAVQGVEQERDEMAAVATVAPSDALATRRAAREQRRSRWQYWLAGGVAAALVVVGALIWRPWAPPPLSATDQVLQAADAQKYTQVVDDQPVTIVRSPSLGRAVMVADALPTIPDGKTYELWLQDDAGKFVSAGLFPDPGSGSVTVPLDGDASTAKGAGLTVEPEGGSPQPTTDPLVLVAFG